MGEELGRVNGLSWVVTEDGRWRGLGRWSEARRRSNAGSVRVCVCVYVEECGFYPDGWQAQSQRMTDNKKQQQSQHNKPDTLERNAAAVGAGRWRYIDGVNALSLACQSRTG